MQSFDCPSTPMGTFWLYTNLQAVRYLSILSLSNICQTILIVASILCLTKSLSFIFSHSEAENVSLPGNYTAKNSGNNSFDYRHLMSYHTSHLKRISLFCPSDRSSCNKNHSLANTHLQCAPHHSFAVSDPLVNTRSF